MLTVLTPNPTAYANLRAQPKRLQNNVAEKVVDPVKPALTPLFGKVHKCLSGDVKT
jgi:hypothetical protein